MINKTETDERQYLDVILGKLKGSLEEIYGKVRKYAQEIQDQKKYLWENKSGMDHVEKISVRQSVDQSTYLAEAIKEKSKRLEKLIASPYFGRFDFIEAGKKDRLAVYVGIHSYFDEDDHTSLVYDWRAPISTMYYDFELGQAEFKAPAGQVAGEILLKRQYRIRKGVMEFMIESDINIHDDVLQKELSCASDDKMKNIVATIQRDQNMIIRNEDSHVLIIQGVAGSGKTSIALHRIAFLLYRFKDSIASSDILILSPNKVFADYIANVLPELGEENIPEIGIEQLASDLLGHEYKFQSFYEQVTYLLENNDKAFEKRIQTKASLDFLNRLNDYIVDLEESYFNPVDITVNGRLVPAWLMEERFKSNKRMPIAPRLEKIAKDVAFKVGIQYNYNVTGKERAEIKEAVAKMFKCRTLKSLYKDFYAWMGEPKLFKLINNSVYEYSDVFPLIYLKIYFEGLKKYEDVKHLLVDEMQDYTPVQYAVLNKLFECKKTILGDANQSVNPFSASNAQEIKKVFTKADTVKLCKSYRSSYQITQFAQKISPNTDLEVVERHGEEPDVIKCQSVDDELQTIVKLTEKFVDSDYHAMGIILRTQAQAEAFHARMRDQGVDVYLLNAKSQAFRQGILILTAHMAKGLEFDHVVVPDVTDVNYKKKIDTSMLYVACTRAMHRLTLTYVGNPRVF